jgi:hypothetical protein
MTVVATVTFSGRAVPQSKRVLDVVGLDPQRDHAAAALELDPIEHQHRQPHVCQRPAPQVDEVLARARDELARDRRLALRPRAASTSAPSRSPVHAERRVDTTASIRPSTASVNASRSAKWR